MLDTFFRINMPYGISRNHEGSWMAFNREYLPLGYNSTTHQQSMAGSPNSDRYAYMNLPVYTTYKGITEKFLLSIAHESEGSIQRDLDGKICRIFFYDDRSNPANNWTKFPNTYWKEYMDRLEVLCKLGVGY